MERWAVFEESSNLRARVLALGYLPFLTSASNQKNLSRNSCSPILPSHREPQPSHLHAASLRQTNTFGQSCLVKLHEKCLSQRHLNPYLQVSRWTHKHSSGPWLIATHYHVEKLHLLLHCRLLPPFLGVPFAQASGGKNETE